MLTVAADVVHSASSSLSYPVEESSGGAAGDVEGLSVTRLNHKVTNLTMHLSPRRGAAAIWEFIIWKEEHKESAEGEGNSGAEREIITWAWDMIKRMT